eukprot:8822954-Karenia_brevis.AAC.1
MPKKITPEDSTYNQTLSVNECPTLTCHNAYLFVISVGCVVRGVADGEREFFRKLLPAERLQLQGFPGSICRHLGSKTQMAAGNAYP